MLLCMSHVIDSTLRRIESILDHTVKKDKRVDYCRGGMHDLEAIIHDA